MQKKFSWLLIFSLSLSFMAYAKEQKIELKNEAFFEKEKVAKNGTKKLELVPVKTAVPGEEVLFVITYKNLGNEAASDIVVTNPVPKNMTFKSAEQDKIVTLVSVDGGTNYDELSKLKIKDRGNLVREALAKDVTHVRWRIPGQLAPKAEGKVKFKAVLN